MVVEGLLCWLTASVFTIAYMAIFMQVTKKTVKGPQE